MIFLATDSGAYDVPLNRLEALPKGRFAVKSLRRKKSAAIIPHEDRSLGRQDEVLLISQGQAASEEVPIKPGNGLL